MHHSLHMQLRHETPLVTDAGHDAHLRMTNGTQDCRIHQHVNSSAW